MPTPPYTGSDNRYPIIQYADELAADQTAAVAAVSAEVDAETARATAAEAAAVAAVTAETTRATTAEGLLAPKASPALTGTITVGGTANITNNGDLQVTPPTGRRLLNIGTVWGYCYVTSPDTSNSITSTPSGWNPAGITNGYKRFNMNAGSSVLNIGPYSALTYFSGASLTLVIRNNSGGAITTNWNAQFKLAAWVEPTNGFEIAITFVYDSGDGKFREVSRSSPIAI
jgi:hypothetical protein